MLIVHVHVRVRSEFIEEFRKASIENARNSVQEAGIARLVVIQQSDAPERFMRIEVCRCHEAALLHRQRTHYEACRDAVAGMMPEPRTSAKYSNVFPGDME